MNGRERLRYCHRWNWSYRIHTGSVSLACSSLHFLTPSRALSKTGLRVLHIDTEANYGGTDASLTLIDLHHLLLSPPSVLANISVPVPIPESLLRDSRNYAISLAPSIVSSVGPLIDTLVNSGVSRYVKFKLLDGVGLYANASNGGAKSSGQEWAGSVKTVPGSKEDVFKSKELGLLQKRKLMKFLMATASQLEQSSENVTNSVDNLPFLKYLTSKEVGLDAEVANAVAYALSLSSDPNGEWYISTSSYSILSMSRSEPDIASKNQRDRPSSDSRNTYVLPADMEIHPF